MKDLDQALLDACDNWYENVVVAPGSKHSMALRRAIAARRNRSGAVPASRPAATHREGRAVPTDVADPGTNVGNVPVLGPHVAVADVASPRGGSEGGEQQQRPLAESP